MATRAQVPLSQWLIVRLWLPLLASWLMSLLCVALVVPVSCCSPLSLFPMWAASLPPVRKAVLHGGLSMGIDTATWAWRHHCHTYPHLQRGCPGRLPGGNVDKSEDHVAQCSTTILSSISHTECCRRCALELVLVVCCSRRQAEMLQDLEFIFVTSSMKSRDGLAC